MRFNQFTLAFVLYLMLLAACFFAMTTILHVAYLILIGLFLCFVSGIVAGAIRGRFLFWAAATNVVWPSFVVLYYYLNLTVELDNPTGNSIRHANYSEELAAILILEMVSTSYCFLMGLVVGVVFQVIVRVGLRTISQTFNACD